VTLREAIERLSEFREDATLYVEATSDEWVPGSRAAVGVEYVEAEVEALPVEAEELTYFLEVSVAREVLVGFAQHLGRDATLDEQVERVIRYARFDA
jgi:hypothetical protein